jgi:diguanylate cyclase (GGDEF)-like protein
LVALLPAARSNDVNGSVWLTVLSFEALLFTISIAFILLAMAKERTELRHRIAALVDPLTGIANRRAFLEEAERIDKRHRVRPRPSAVLLIDLDHFKSINDRFGHALGDRVLEIFTEAARQSVLVSDLIGRMGGVEFAAVLYDTTSEKAVAVAQRIRESVAKAAQDIDGRPVCATVSIGVVLAAPRRLPQKARPEHAPKARRTAPRVSQETTASQARNDSTAGREMTLRRALSH